MCGRYLFSAEQNAELTQIVKAVERRYGQNSVPQGEIRPTVRRLLLSAKEVITSDALIFLSTKTQETEAIRNEQLQYRA